MSLEIRNNKVFEEISVELSLKDLERIKQIYVNQIAEKDAKIAELQTEKVELENNMKPYSDAIVIIKPK